MKIFGTSVNFSVNFPDKKNADFLARTYRGRVEAGESITRVAATLRGTITVSGETRGWTPDHRALARMQRAPPRSCV